MAEHLFLTGGTGFVGSRLVRLWLQRTDARVTVLTRGGADANDPSRPADAAGLGSQTSRAALGPRIEFVVGDLATPRLGLDPSTRERIVRTATHVVHAGAELRFDRKLEEARRTNTAGTAAVLDLARQCPRLERIDYVSTAFTAGRGSRVVLEETCHDGMEHNNAYERSKYEAELLVQEAMSELPATVLRPTIVTCDPRSGYAPPTSAFYRLLRGIATGTLEVLPGRAVNQLDMAPVDYVAEAIFAIGRHPDASGRCFHVGAGARRRLRLGEMRDLVCDTFGRERVKILPPEEFSEWAAIAGRIDPSKQALLNELALYAPYLSDHPVFDDRNTCEVLDGTGLVRPPITEYLDRIASYVRGTVTGNGRCPSGKPRVR